MSATTMGDGAGRTVSARQIRELADRIAAEFRPDRIILFGSHAAGEATEDSDVDLFVIMPFEGRALRASLEIANRVKPTFAVDILARRSVALLSATAGPSGPAPQTAEMPHRW